MPESIVELFAQLDHTLTMLATSPRQYTDEWQALGYQQLTALFDEVRGVATVAAFRRRSPGENAGVENAETGERR